MTFFLDKLNALRKTLGLPEDAAGYSNIHMKLDECDKACGVITRHRPDARWSWDEGSATYLRAGRYCAPVGERLRRLERHVENHLAPAYFWLGEEAA